MPPHRLDCRSLSSPHFSWIRGLLLLVLLAAFAPTSAAGASGTAAGKLLSPSFNPEGRCAGDLPGLQVFFEDTEQYSDPKDTFPGFTDVETHDTYCRAIRNLVSRGAVGGYSDGTFRPYNVVTRGQFSKMIVKQFDYTLISPMYATYADVPVGSTFYTFVETASVNNLVTGNWGVPGFWNPCIPPNGGYEQDYVRYFRPCLNITRGQMAKPLSQAANYSESASGRQTFLDVSSTYNHHVYVERLAMHISLEEIPFDTPGRPICYGTTLPCYHPNWDVRRSDAAQLIYLAYIYSAPYPAGRAFPRRFRVLNNGHNAGYDGVQGFVKTPFTNPPSDKWIAGPLALHSSPNSHFVESGPYRTCSAASDQPDAPDVCLNHPYATSATACTSCTEQENILTSIFLASGASYEYRSYAVPSLGEWWSEFYDPGLGDWRRIITVTEMGTSALHEVNGAAETSRSVDSFPSGFIRYTNVRAHHVGEPANTWHGWCPDRTVYQRFMFLSGASDCPPPGAEPYSWDVWYTPNP